MLAAIAALWCLNGLVPRGFRLAAFGLAFGSLIAPAVVRLSPSVRRMILLAISILMVGVLTGVVITVPPPVPWRVGLITILFSYILLFAVWARSTQGTRRPARLLGIGVVTLGLVLLAEVLLGEQLPPSLVTRVHADSQVLIRAPAPTPGSRYAPSSETRVFYPDDPRGYFESASEPLVRWTLRVDSGHGVARLDEVAEGEVVRVRIESARGREAWRIQAVQSGWSVTRGTEYRVSMRARAPARRRVGVSLSADPLTYGDVGFAHRRVLVDTAWSRFEDTFTATQTDENVHLLIDLGDSRVAAEFSNVVITELPSGRRAVPSAARTSYVHYRFNRDGCRGADVATPRAVGTTRILALGDAYTLGAGVHEQDTWPARLQRLLNESRDGRGQASYEVVNCGVVGYGVAEERALFDSLVRVLSPDVVLLALNPGDDTLRATDVRQTGFRPSGKLDRFLLTVGWLRQRLGPDIAPLQAERILTEVRVLRDSAAARNIRLVVILFEHQRDAAGRRSQARLGGALTAANIPTLSLERVLRAFQESTLVVHSLYDPHPSDVAHRAASEALFRFLRDRAILATPREQPAASSPSSANRAARR